MICSCQTLILPAVIILSSCKCTSPAPDTRAQLVDSLLKVTGELHERISSPGMQQLNELHSETRNDLEVLNGLSTRLTAGELKLADEFQVLDSQLNGCLRSCGKFHEELYLVEFSLKELYSLLEKNQPDSLSFKDRIAVEISLLDELNERIDNALSLTSVHLHYYNALKPAIDSVISRHKVMIGINE